MDILSQERDLLARLGGNTIEWNARLRMREHELDGSFYVHLFLGDVPDSQENWMDAPNLVGTHFVYTSSTGEHEGAGVQVEGFVCLQKALKKMAGLENLESSAVVPYLKKNLRWRVVTIDGRVANDELKSLNITVFTIDYRDPESSFTEYPECTEGNDGY